MTQDLLSKAEEFENRSLSHMSTSDRVEASREAKKLILSINEIYKKTKDSKLMETMKSLTEKKRKITNMMRVRNTLPAGRQEFGMTCRRKLLLATDIS